MEGEALVSPDGFSARYDLDRTTGVISRESHALYGKSIAGKVFVCPLAKGGFATSWALLDLKSRGLAPIARSTPPSSASAPLLSEDALWRCHAQATCTEVCPMELSPTNSILRLRRRAVASLVHLEA